MFFELHRGLPREGPGDDASTRRALRSVAEYLPERPAVLDIGCGPGSQTIVLAEALPDSHVIAVDMHEPFLEELKRRAEAAGMDERIRPRKADMCALPFAASSFDLIWSEGALWIAGFAKGLRQWKVLAKAGGCIVVSELAWITRSPESDELAFWSGAYPSMKHDHENRELISSAGLELLEAFRLPRSSWFEQYLAPLERRAEELLLRYEGDSKAVAWIRQQCLEIEIARCFSGFAYIFYVMRTRCD